MIRSDLTLEQRAVVQALRHDRTLRPAERDRVEMVLLSAAGWSPPRIGRHLDCHPATVRQVLKRFGADGAAALRWRQPGPPKDTARRRQVCGALERLLDQERTCTGAQLAEAPRAEGIALSPRQTRKYLKLLGARWRRTVSTLKHRQDPARVERAGRVLANLKKGRRRAAPARLPRRVRLQPQPAGDLQLGPPRSAQARAVREPAGATPECAGRHGAVGQSDGAALAGGPPVVRGRRPGLLPGAAQRPDLPTVVVLDNAGFHRAHLAREAPPRPRQLGVFLYHLPPYSPELNDIERLFRTIKHYELPARTYPTFDALQEAVHAAFTRHEHAHCLKPAAHPGLAA